MTAAPAPAVPPVGIYAHVPFCETKCPYCDFNTYSRIEPMMPAYLSALKTEIEAWAAALRRPPARTLFFGGGTPSYLPEGEIAALLNAIRDAFPIAPDAEITLEANPGDLTDRKLDEFARAGINRLSVGVQAFDDRLLNALGRRHDSARAKEAIRAARRAGFDNLSLDLMFGLPNQSAGDWRASVDAALELEPDHVSMYCLTLEPGTPFERWVRQGDMAEPDPDLAADMYEVAMREMARAGYDHYEISNWAKPGRESAHNLIYWRCEPYLGLGPGAHSYLPPYRFANLRPPREYVRRLEQAAHPANPGSDDLQTLIENIPVVEDVEPIDPALRMSETMMMTLRLSEGVNRDDFAREFGRPPEAAYPDAIPELTALGLLQNSNGALKLTRRGRMLGNEVFARFFDPA